MDLPVQSVKHEQYTVYEKYCISVKLNRILLHSKAARLGSEISEGAVYY